MSRTAVNVEAGARTQLSSLTAVVMVILALQFFTSLFYYIPLGVLAATIVVAVIFSLDFDVYREAYKCPTAVRPGAASCAALIEARHRLARARVERPSSQAIFARRHTRRLLLIMIRPRRL